MGESEPTSSGPGGVLSGIAIGIAKVDAAWKKASLPVKFLAVFVVMCGVGVPSFLIVWKTVSHEKSGAIINGPIIGQQVGDHNQQDVTLVNNRRGYQEPRISSTEQVGENWVTEVSVPMSPGIWDQTTTTQIKLHLSVPYEQSHVEGWSGFMAGTPSRWNAGEAATRGLFLLQTITAPSKEVSVLFLSKKPLEILWSEVHPPGPPSGTSFR